MLNGLSLDFRQAARGLWKARGLSAAIIVTLALGTGASATMFSVLRASLLRPLPFPEPHRLVVVGLTERAPGQPPRRTSLPNPAYEFIRDNSTSLEGVAAYTLPNFNIGGYDQPERVQGEVVSANYFSVLGATATRGRGFMAGDDSAGAPPALVISHALWLRRFGADSGLVGRQVSLNRFPVVVAGIMPAGFAGLSGRAELWIPRSLAPVVAFPYRSYSVVARLKPGRTLEHARAELSVLGGRLAAALPGAFAPDVERIAEATPVSEARVDPANRTSVLILFGAVGVLLLIACANVANLLLARAHAREREIAVRLALGTSGRGLIRLLLTESALLSALGGLAGIVVAWGAIALITPLIPLRPFMRGPFESVGDFALPQLDLSVLAFTWILAAGVALLFGLAPAIRAARTQPVEALNTGGRLSRGRRRNAFGLDAHGFLTVAEIALAVILLAGSGLLLRSLWRLATLPLGFDSGNLVTFQVQTPTQWYQGRDAALLVERLVDAASRVPGVDLATGSYYTPFDAGARHQVRLPGGDNAPGGELWGGRHYVTPGYFETLRIPIRRGRPFTADDRPGRPLVAVVSEAAARRFWPGEDPLGKRFFIGMGRNAPPDSALEVVGVAADVSYRPSPYQVEPNVYTPYYQFVTNVWALLIVRSNLPPARLVPALRDAVISVDPNLPIDEIQTMDERGGGQLARRRLNAILLTVFAGLALAIATVGVYGVISHQSAQRTREFGIRIAIGAKANDVLLMVVLRAVTLVAIGLGLGVPAALALSRVLAAQLYGVEPTDPLTYLLISGVLTAVALIASYLPARRASRMATVIALRAE